MRSLPRLLVLAVVLAAAPAAMAGAADEDPRVKARSELQALSAQLLPYERAYQLVHEVVGPSVVAIHISERFRLVDRFGMREEIHEIPIGEGSGFVFHSDDKGSYVLTNAHVVVQTNERQEFATLRGKPMPYDRVAIQLHDGRVVPAEYVGVDTRTDLAVLKVQIPRLPAIEWGNSDDVRVGQHVVALGYPLGAGYSATFGNVSATDKSTGIYRRMGGFEAFIQTDAAINPGNSGGPLANIAGQVIGVNANIISRTGTSAGLGFAIPALLARRVAEDLLDDGKVELPKLGLYPNELKPEEAQRLGLPPVPTVVVDAVLPEGPAEKAGIKAGDVVVAINGIQIGSDAQFRARIASARIGSPLPVTVQRDGKLSTVQVVPVRDSDIQQNIDRVARDPRNAGGGLAPFGMKVGLDGRAGLVVLEVAPDSPAARAGIARGDRILRERAYGALRGQEDLDALANRDEVVLQVLHDGGAVWKRLQRQ